MEKWWNFVIAEKWEPLEMSPLIFKFTVEHFIRDQFKSIDALSRQWMSEHLCHNFFTTTEA